MYRSFGAALTLRGPGEWLFVIEVLYYRVWSKTTAGSSTFTCIRINGETLVTNIFGFIKRHSRKIMGLHPDDYKRLFLYTNYTFIPSTVK